MTGSETLFEQAQAVIPGGVNSPVRAFNGVGGQPLFFKQGEGAYLIDEDDQRYIDYVCSWGPLILGHAHPAIIDATTVTLAKGLSFGAPCALEVEMATTICELIPSIEKVRMVNSGTEATMSALRLARAYTERDKIVKFNGCYHGHVDALLVAAGSGALTLGVPNSPGIPAAVTAETLTADYNDVDAIEQLFQQFGAEIAAVIVEPIAANMNFIPASQDFLTTLRQLCDQYASVLIFDEVMTGFRVNIAGAQALYNIQPDLTTLGKIIGAGMPVGAFGGKAEIMNLVAPLGPVYQAGTLSGNPIAMRAGLSNLIELTKPGVYDKLADSTTLLTAGLLECAAAHNIPLHIQAATGMFGLFFTEQTKIERFSQLANCNIERYQQFFHAMLAHGVYFAPSAYEVAFISTQHDPAIIDATLAAAEQVFAAL